MSENWKELRARNIGGSEIAALFNKSPWITYFKLWHIKRGLIVPEEFDNERTLAGKFLEPAILSWANHKWDLDLYQPQIYVEHGSLKGAGCTPDALSASDSDLMAQVKNVDSLQFACKWEYEGETITKAPLDILLQVQYEMEVCNKERSYLIVCVGGNRLYFMLCERDRQTGDILTHAVAWFWADTEPPQPDFERDLETIKALRKSLPTTEREDLSQDADLFKTLQSYQRTKQNIAERSDKLEAMKAEIIYAAKQYEGFECRNYSVFFDKRGALKIEDKEIRF